jgi:hypothetical protein
VELLSQLPRNCIQVQRDEFPGNPAQKSTDYGTRPQQHQQEEEEEEKKRKRKKS